MIFSSKEDLLNKISVLKEIGNGSQGTCYLESKTNSVYKIFNQVLDDDDDKIIYSQEEFLRFNHIHNNTFIWPNEIIMINEEIVGYITKYIKAKPLYTINPLDIDLNTLYNALVIAQNDIKLLSQNGVLTFDIMYNIMFSDKLYVTDCDEFSYSNKSEKLLITLNKYNFNIEFYYFLIMGYFDEFIKEFHQLNKMFNDRDENILEFLKLFRNYLSEYVGFEIQKLGDAKDCLNKEDIYGDNYFRVLSK